MTSSLILIGDIKSLILRTRKNKSIVFIRNITKRGVILKEILWYNICKRTLETPTDIIQNSLT